MAITDLQISDTLQTGAPSIKYRGNEGPQAPMQMAEADPMLVEEYQKYVFEMEEQGLQPISFEEFKAQAMSGMAEGGRARYGLGSFVRKLIPNEVAKVAEVAAPFVAPFNPIAGGLMAGLGGYDRTGNLMGGVKRGLLTYGGGQLARGIGGGLGNLQTGIDPRTGMQGMGSGWKKYFSNPVQKSGGIGQWLNKRKAPAITDKITETISGTADDLPVKSVLSKASEAKLAANKGTSSIMDLINKSTGKIILGAMAGTGLYTALQQRGNIAIDDLEKIARGEGMDIEGIRKEVREALAGGEEAWNELKKKYPYIGEYDTKIRAAEGGRIGFYAGGGAGYPAVTFGQAGNPPPMPAHQPRPNPMPAPQPMSGGIMGGGMNPMARGMNPMARGMNPMGGMPRGMNPMGGMPRRMAQEGGLMDLGGMEKDYRNEGGFVPIGGQEKADDVPARLSKNEFVFTADAVRNAGGGDIDKGAGIMERVMENLEQGGKISEESQGLSGAQEMFDVSERLSEVV
jgi:hypothetical protein